MPEASYESERRAMIEDQLRRRGISDERVLEAMQAVPRHEFVPMSAVDLAYQDRPVPIGEAETISQPYMVAVMTEAASIQPGEKVLEVGAGSGYQAAILAYLGAKVYAIERNYRLVDLARSRLARLGYGDVEVIWGDGTEGYCAAAPYDVMLVTAGAPRVPDPLRDQLGDGGRLLIPIGDRRQQNLYLISRSGNEFFSRVLDPCQFVPLIGRYGWPEENETIQ